MTQTHHNVTDKAHKEPDMVKSTKISNEMISSKFRPKLNRKISEEWIILSLFQPKSKWFCDNK